MSTFIYEAYNRDGRLVKGEWSGEKREEAVEYISKQGLTPVTVEKISAKNENGGMALFERIGSVDIMFLVRSLATTIKAGLSIVEAIDILLMDTEKKLMKKILQDVKASIKNGQSLSSSFEIYSKIFPAVFIGMLKAGEASGQLDKTLGELAKYLAREYSLRSRIKAALAYPVILIVASILVVMMLLIFVLPRMIKSFTSGHVELPLITKFFIWLSNVLTWSFVADSIAFLFLMYFIFFFKRTEIGKKFFAWLMSNTPVVKDLVKKVSLVRFSRTFGNLMSSGLSAVESLELSGDSIGNDIYSKAIKETIVEIKNGATISDALAKYPKLFPRILVSLIIVGERTGTLHEVLNTFAEFYDEEVDNSLKALTSMLEPILLLIMGLAVGAIALAIVLPIYKLVGSYT
ncbi:MAG: type II secretion system F family protein [Candidatus Pacebacteria bacterium]|nr:type II secretion system F family protein [Candidatus Paceibacterota bacterium]